MKYIILICGFLNLIGFSYEAFCEALHENTASLSFNVEEAVTTVLNNYPTIKEANEALRCSMAGLNESRSDYYPKLTANFGYTRLDPDPAIDFPGLGSIQLFPENNYDINLHLKYNILGLGKTNSQVDLAKSRLDSSQNNIDLLKNNLAFETIQIFYLILLLDRSIEVQNKQIDSLNEHLEITKKKVSSGTATDFDALTTKVKVAEATTQKIELQNLLNKEQITLKRLLGAPDDTAIILKGDFPNSPLIFDENGLIAKAQNQRIEVKLAENLEKTALMGYRIAKSDYDPSLNLNLSYGTKNGYLPNLDTLKQNWIGNVEFSIPLFEGFKTPNKVKEADAKLMIAKLNKWDSQAQVASEVRKSLSDVRADFEKMSSTELHVKLAQEALSQAKIRYESGIITNLDLINAETALAQARLFNIQALHDYVISGKALKKSIGDRLWE